MATRVEESTLAFPVNRRRAKARARASSISRVQRLLFVLALVAFGLSSTYSSIALLARVTPALFPGKDLTSLGIIRPLAKLDAPFVPIKAPSDTSVFNKRINLLVLGVDRRPAFGDDGQPLPIPDDENAGYLTDTIMVATIDPVAKTSAVLSFPRDMLIDIHTKDFTYEDRINTSYGVGVRNGKTVAAGTTQLELDMKANFGIDIDHYVILDFKGVEKLVDAVGGVQVDIPDDLSV
ncbi:MAG: LCP family protein, partial [Tepidiformaceae bacterium]